MLELSSILVVGFLLDLLVGDPRYACHPIRLMGRCISLTERLLVRLKWNKRAGGIFLAIIIEAAFLAAYLQVSHLLHSLHPLLGLCFDFYIFYSCLALGDLVQHVNPVIPELKHDRLERARKILAMVVGRDVRFLDKKGMCRAAVETLAENFVDGFLSPLFWYVTGGVLAYFAGLCPVRAGLACMVAFKVASTLDSMVGYKDPQYALFGWAGARLDDIANFLPARISLFILFMGAWITGQRPVNGFRVALRDRLRHDSPNAGHAESFVAGALLIRLGGPTRYTEGLKQKAWLNKGNPDPEPVQIQETIRLIRCSAWIAVGLSLPSLFLPA